MWQFQITGTVFIDERPHFAANHCYFVERYEKLREEARGEKCMRKQWNGDRSKYTYGNYNDCRTDESSLQQIEDIRSDEYNE